eukprot:6485836-Amphidinium_carterae.1
MKCKAYGSSMHPPAPDSAGSAEQGSSTLIQSLTKEAHEQKTWNLQKSERCGAPGACFCYFCVTSTFVLSWVLISSAPCVEELIT